jgi:regulator of sigma E protease
MLNFWAFLFALTLLVSVHEWGHYRVAVALGVKVLRFSIGLGHPVWRWRKPNQRQGQDTEVTVGWLPLGGYVLMLDEAQGPVSPEASHQAFNRQPLWARALIVAAGPVANLALAVWLLAAAAWWGQDEPMALISTPVAQSAADKAGLIGGERVVAAGAVPSDSLEPMVLRSISSFGDLLPQATQALRQGQDWELEVQAADALADTPRRVRLLFAHLPPLAKDEQASPLVVWGLGGPRAAATVVKVEPGSPAAVAGLLPGDRVLKVQGQTVPDAQFLRQTIRQSVASGVSMPLVFQVSRADQVLELPLQPAVVMQGQQQIGRMGAVVGAPPSLQWVSHGALESVALGARKTYDLTALTVRMLGGLFSGQGGLDQLGGPLTIADQAGRSAQLGLTAYLGFLGFLSISLGVLNLLPLPMLDGGHLMYYLWELLTGKPVSSDWVNVLQKVGLMLLVAVMVTALVNDGIRLLR